MRKYLFSFAAALLDIIVNIWPQEWLTSPWREITTIVLTEVLFFSLVFAWLVPKLPKKENLNKMIPSC